MEWVGWIVGVGGVDCGSGWSGLWEWVGWIVGVGGVDCGSGWGGVDCESGWETIRSSGPGSSKPRIALTQGLNRLIQV